MAVLTDHKRLMVLVFIISVVLTIVSFYIYALAGDLEPTDPPAPTMKTLDEVEARTPIHADDLPLVITESGSYYLAENITFSTPDINGITITASDVTIDLNGFTLKGPGTASTWVDTGHGITVDSNLRTRITILNGSVVNWASGIQLITTGVQIRDIKASGNPAHGIGLGGRSIIERCVTNGNGSVGIYTTNDSLVKDCVSMANSASYMTVSFGKGIEVGSGSVVTECTASFNHEQGIAASSNCTVENCVTIRNGSAGILTGRDSIVRGCTSNDNEFIGLIIDSGDGISTGNGSTIVGCACSGNRINGISAGESSVVVNCTARDNQVNGIAGNYCRIMNCTAGGNDSRGILVSFGCLIVGNVLDRNDIGIMLNNNGNAVRDNHFYMNTTYGLQAITGENYSGQNTFYNNGTDIQGGHKQGTGDMANIIIP